MSRSHNFRIQQLRAMSAHKTVEALAVLVAALFISALLPSILFKYVYANQALNAQPKMLEYIPQVAFVVGVGYYFFAVVGNMMREKQAKLLEKSLDAMPGHDCCDDGECEDGCCDCCGSCTVDSGNQMMSKPMAKSKKMAKK
jgi:hypothetical protein